MVSSTTKQGADLSQAALALLARRRQGSTNGTTTSAIGRRPLGDGPLPLSLAQQRLWFLERLRPGTAVYNVPMALRLRGPLDSAPLERALTELVHRHETLRTQFLDQDGRPSQVVLAPASVPLPLVRLKSKHTQGATDERESYVRLRMLEEARRPLDLDRGPLLRAVLHRLDRRDHLLLVTVHHLVSDAWSSAILARELGQLYTAFADGVPSPLVDLPIQYGDYAVWQHSPTAEAEVDRQLAYWETRLADLEPLRLPLDHPRSRAGEGQPSARLGLTLSRPLTDALRQLGQREGATLFMTVLAAFQALLARASGGDDIAVGAPIAGRTRPETDGLIGFFINTLVLRTDLAGNPTFREILRRARETALGAYSHQDVPFERLVERLRPERDLGSTPLFQVFLNMRNLAERPVTFGPLEVERLDAHAEGAKFDLSLEVAEGPGGLRFVFVFNADLFEPDTVQALATHFEQLLAVVVEDPDQRLTAISLPLPETWPLGLPMPSIPLGRTLSSPLTADLRSPVLPATATTISARFAEQVAARPDHLALRAGGETWTYAELDRAVNWVAAALAERLPNGGERVALLFDHGPAMVTALLGVLKAGHAFVPLDPSYPPERIGALLGDAQPAALLSHGPQLANARAVAGLSLPVIDIAAAGAAESDPGDSDGAATSPAAPAYLLYTSGSTGQPKGVVQSHRNAVHHALAYAQALGVGPTDRLALLAPLATDTAVQDILAALLNGASLHPLDLRAVGVERIGPWLAEEGITVYHSTPTVFRHFVRCLTDESFPSVRRVVLGGELAGRQDVERFRRHFSPAAVLVNGLGLTESTTALQYVVTADTAVVRDSLPIGTPVAGTEISLLDRAGNPIAGFGVGEIAIRGEFVALGYWRRPDLTEAAFGPDPAGGTGRAYRTGDLGRTLPDGMIEHFGRKDAQVKIRGFRVEPAEVEAALTGHDAVREAVVVAPETTPGERRLIAYVVLHDVVGGKAPLPDDLRRYLRAKLPEHLVPAAIVPLDALPLTASGKLDRRSLPAPEEALGSATFISPRTPTEQEVAAVWARVLGVDQIGVDDHFFDLGGHSLLVTQVMSRLREALGVDLPVRALFDAPTVAQLAERVDAARADVASGVGPAAGIDVASTSSIVVLQPNGDQRPVFLVPGGAGDAVNLFKMTKLTRLIGDDRPFYGFFAQESFDDPSESPQTWVETVAAGYVRELRARQPEGPYLLGGTCLGGSIAFEMGQQLHAAGQEVLRLFLLDAWRPGARRGFDPAEQSSRRLTRRDARRAERGKGGDGRRAGKHRVSAPDGDALFARRWRLQRYQASPYGGPVVLMVNEEWHGLNPDLGWGTLATGGIEVIVMPGGHGQNLVDNLELTAERLRQCLVGL